MKLLLQSDWQSDNMTSPVIQAISQLRWKGEEPDVREISLGILSLPNEGLGFEDYTPIGTVEFVKTFAEKVGVKLPAPIHATELLQLEGRWYFNNYSRFLLKGLDEKTTVGLYPCFVKPHDELKKFTGFVARSDKDFDLYPDVDWATTKLFCTEVLENIVSEWRCYVLNGKVFACVNYAGESLNFPFRYVIHELIEKFTNAPVAYSLDVAIVESKTGYKTQFIEINDAYALGYYGGDVELYTKMLDLRWFQIRETLNP